MKQSAHERAARENIYAWLNSSYYGLRCVYNDYSWAKEQAWEHCVSLCNQFDGTRLRIISYNRYIFTAGFSYTDKDTGVEMFYYITPSYDVAVEL